MKLYGLPRVTVSSSGYKNSTTKHNPVPFLEHIHKFNLDLSSPRYSNSPHVSCLGMNPGGGWNPNLEGSYLLGYSESEAVFWTQCKSGFYLRPVKVLGP